MDEPSFLTWDDALVIHEDSLLTYGGRIGLPNPGYLESALAAPQNLFLYEIHASDDRQGIAKLAATYWVHLALAHAFADGNKRMGLGCAILFLYTNGYDLELPDEEAYDVGIAVAQRLVDRDELAGRLEPLLCPLESDSE
ncbi:type II toxin-antitoxin system death-on-curing family toxin [bacterium]|nr:MAG: type II toxin-antitoxin system death-on-curing family toxin [bacterium]